MNAATQKAKLLDHLKNTGPITSLEAVRKFNILRPSNRIQELKAEGYDIHTEIVWKKHKDGSMTHYAKYSMG